MNKFIQKNRKSSQSFQAEKITINNQQKNDNVFDERKEKNISNIKAAAGGASFIIALIPILMLFSNQVLVTKNSYLLKETIEKEYVPITKYTELQSENEQLKSKSYDLQTENEKMKNEKDNQGTYKEWLKRYDQLVQERNGLETQLSNLINFSTGIKGDTTSNEIKKEELLRKIQSRNEQILVLENKLY